MQPVVDIKDVSVIIDKKQILSNITAQIPKGKIVGLLGPSGAGKTTLIRTILGLQKPSDGSISVLGLEAGSKSLRSQIGYVTQALSVYSDLTVRENVQYFAALLGVSKREADAVIKAVEMDEYANRLVAILSGGQKARVSLAVALLGEPKLLLLDEPTVGLDPVLRQNLWAIFRKMADAGTTLLISSHVMDEADRCDDLIFLRDGKLLIADTRTAVLTKTKTTSMEAAFLSLAKGGEE